ncbi:hypothetical protein EYF80_041246 [Liparis tanakae]|uniref:Uncharacterized protein n=1 Tax=Liparis tanakae TaxID=230148 RepID=A0A4Z2G5Y2_9TELE|nr:hypothetical protein EYF80_041246 [Liparis tanakae]
MNAFLNKSGFRCVFVVYNLGRRALLRLSGAAVLVADETPPQQRAAAGRTVALHGQQVGRLRLQEVFGEADHRKQLDVSSSSSSCSSSSSSPADCSFFLALTLPKAMGMCSGGCRPGSKSIRYSCLSQRAVSGRRLQGGARSMLETTRQWNSRLDSFREHRATWERRLEE